jgi:hypothetical protein
VLCETNSESLTYRHIRAATQKLWNWAGVLRSFPINKLERGIARALQAKCRDSSLKYALF